MQDLGRSKVVAEALPVQLDVGIIWMPLASVRVLET
jgi:hypothetical protein